MKPVSSATLTNPLTHFDKSTSLLNLMVSFWFKGAKEKIDKSSDTLRKKKWAKLDPFDMQILIPPVGSGRYYLVDRPGALLLAHTAVPDLTWVRLFQYLNTINPPGTPPNAAIATLIQQGTTLKGIKAALQEDTTWSSDPALWKTHDANGDDVILITGTPQTDTALATLIQSEFFQGFQFQSLIYTYNTEPEAGKPAYYTASLAADDTAFAPHDRKKTLYVVNMGQFKPDIKPASPASIRLNAAFNASALSDAD